MEIRIGRLRTTVLDAPEESAISQQHNGNALTELLRNFRLLKLSVPFTALLLAIFLILCVPFIDARHHKIHFENLCKEPSDLNWRLFRWFTETSELEIVEVNDEDWSPPVPESSFCSIKPVTGINSTTMQRSLCPWQWKFAF
ncbi:unnamed protein product [Litomosoides sigmodontis]|uniref:Uncharacterized protein n=1 Tax=Litomosoides sigmodontis TaxID=42156 RepID=A0A3P6TAI1_LITSI|nr:unnamed protein product [Litomosoides sigmodontis]